MSQVPQSIRRLLVIGIQGQSFLHVLVLGDVHIVVVVDKLVRRNLRVYEQGRDAQEEDSQQYSLVEK